MRYATVKVTKAGAAGPLSVTVGVAVERPGRAASSYLRCSDGDAPEGCRAGALSGGRYARHAVDRHDFGIDVRVILGDLDHHESAEGAAMAAMFAVWRACGRLWTDDEARSARGWSPCEGVGS